MSLNNLSVTFSDLGHLTQALETAEEAVRLLAPFVLRQPAAFAGSMEVFVKIYLEHAEALGRIPDVELLTPIVELLERRDPSTR